MPGIYFDFWILDSDGKALLLSDEVISLEEARISGRQMLLLIVGSVTVMGHLYMVP